MLPAQRKKIDLSTLTEEEKKLFAKYGKLPTHKNVLTKMQKDRKYFDSGDYALSKAGVAPPTTVGTAIPNPENIPHASSPPSSNGLSHMLLSTSPTNPGGSPIKETSTVPPEFGPETAEAVPEPIEVGPELVEAPKPIDIEVGPTPVEAES